VKAILITGGAGFVGCHIVKAIVQRGWKVIALDNFEHSVFLDLRVYSSFGAEKFRDDKSSCIYIKGDIRDEQLLKKLFRQYSFDTIIHLAAIADAGVALRSTHLCNSVNVEGLKNIFSAISIRSCVKRFIFFSSSYVYGDFLYEPVDEGHPLSPQHIYGISKLKGEEITKVLCAEKDIDYTIVRLTAVYGFGNWRCVCYKMIFDALAKRRIIVHNQGSDKLDLTHISDVIDGVFKIVKSQKAKNQVFNISRGRARTILELAELICKEIPGVKVIEQGTDFKRPLRGALDISRAKDLLHFKPRVDLEKGIRRCVDELNKKRRSIDFFI